MGGRRQGACPLDLQGRLGAATLVVSALAGIVGAIGGGWLAGSIGLGHVALVSAVLFGMVAIGSILVGGSPEERARGAGSGTNR